MYKVLMPLLIWGCTDKSDTGEIESPKWNVFADQIGEGMLLSAWSQDSRMLAVGGGMDGTGPGVRVIVDGDTVCTETLLEDRALWWIHGSTPDDYYMVGEQGTILHSVNGKIFREDVDTTATLYGVWADENGNVTAVGGDVSANTGEIWRRTEGEWSLFISELEGVAFKVWRNWVVGDRMAWYLAGDTADEMVARPPGERLLTVRGSSDDDVWAVGGSASAVVLHWHDGEWEDVSTSGLSLPLMGIWTDADEDIWVSGMSGTQGVSGDEIAEWTIPDFPVSAEHFHAVWKHEEDVFFLGGNMMASAGPWYGSILHYGEPRNATQLTTCSDD